MDKVKGKVKDEVTEYVYSRRRQMGWVITDGGKESEGNR